MEQLFFIDSSGKRRRGEYYICNHCGEKFVSRAASSVKYCSKKCSSDARQKRVLCVCSSCGESFSKKESQLANSKYGLQFCSRKCKDFAQRLDGITEMHPPHYSSVTGKEASDYSRRAKDQLGKKCMDCGIDYEPLLTVHHKDGDRSNNAIENLEVLCCNHHALRHMKWVGKWIYSSSSLTPRGELDKIRSSTATLV